MGENLFSELPTEGLQNLKKLKTFKNRALQDFPERGAFPEIQYLVLSYAYHCCQFLPSKKEVGSSPWAGICQPTFSIQFYIKFNLYLLVTEYFI